MVGRWRHVRGIASHGSMLLVHAQRRAYEQSEEHIELMDTDRVREQHMLIVGQDRLKQEELY